MKRSPVIAGLWPRTLGARLALVMAVLFAAGLAGVGTAALGHLRASQRQAADYQMALTEQIAADLDARLEAAVAALDTVAGLAPAGLAADAEAAGRWLAERDGLRLAWFGHGLFLLRADGQPLAMLSGQPQLAEQPALRQWAAKTVAIDEPLISAPFAAPIATAGVSQPQSVLLAAVPLANGAVLAGVMDLSAAGLLNVLADARLGEDGYFYVVDRTGRLLMGSRNVSAGVTAPPAVLDLASQGGREAVATTAAGEPVLATLTKLQTTGWVLGANVPLAEAYAEVDDLKRELAVFLMFGMLAAAGVTWTMMRLFARPIRTLTDELAHISGMAGRLAPLPDRGGGAEIVQLTAVANALIARIDDDMAQMALAASVFDSVSEGIIVTAPDTRIVLSNRAFAAMTGYAPAEIVGQKPRILRSDRHDSDFYRRMWLGLNNGGAWRGEIWNKRKNGEVFPALLNINVVRDAEGNILHYLAIMSDITEIVEVRTRLESMATTDALTGLPNRALFNDRLNHALAHARRNRRMVGIAYIDLDRFKAINDREGQHLGDHLLLEVTERLRAALRAEDSVARLGGDEFALLIGDVTDMGTLTAILDRLRANIAHPYDIDGCTVEITASIGLTAFPLDDADSDTLLRHADQAMYQAKSEGRNRVVLFDVRHDSELRTRHQRRFRLRQALGTGELELYYQPKVNMRTGCVLGVEALLRWRHPEQGLLTPPAFLDEFANDEILIEIGVWVMEEAMQRMGAWLREAGIAVPISVNLTARHLARPDFVGQVREMLTRHPDVHPDWLEIEILESDVLQDLRSVQHSIEACRAMGVRFAIDDFGTGYSSLAYLKNIPANTLKVDRSFIRDMLDDADDQAIVKGVISLAGVFHRDVVAEGVETAFHETALVSMGCELGQGYGIARPMPAGEILDWIHTYASANVAKRAAET